MGLKKLKSKNRATSIQKMKIFFQFLLRTVKKKSQKLFCSLTFLPKQTMPKKNCIRNVIATIVTGNNMPT